MNLRWVRGSEKLAEPIKSVDAEVFLAMKGDAIVWQSWNLAQLTCSKNR